MTPQQLFGVWAVMLKSSLCNVDENILQRSRTMFVAM